MAQGGNRAYNAGGINTASLRWQPIPMQRQPEADDTGDMLTFINNMYGQMQTGRQNQLTNVLKAAELQGSVEDAQARMKLMQEQEAREALKSQLDMELARQTGARAEEEFKRLPEREKAQRQFELDKATIPILPTLSDQTRGPLRFLNPSYAEREEAQRVVDRDKLLKVNREAIKNLSPKKKKEFLASVTDPDVRMQLTSELEQEGKKQGGGTATEGPSVFEQLNSPQGMPIPYPDVGKATRAVLPTAPMLTVDPELRDPAYMEAFRRVYGGGLNELRL